jgi:hypothetical protein
MAEGARVASEALESGRAQATLEAWVRVSQR